MNILDLIIAEDISVVKALKQMDISSKGIVFICDEAGTLKGSLTDGDIRRYILRGGDLAAPVIEAANTFPKSIFEEDFVSDLDYKHLKCIPVVNNLMQIVSLRFPNEILRPKKQLNTAIVIMAGGKGTRLKPYTDILPKPLIPIGDRTITEHIIDQFLQYDCNNFLMLVNHSKALIKAYFGELDKQYNLTFVDEDEPLGTGGGLALLEDKLHSTFILSNCDILINSDYAKMVEHHQKIGNIITVVCAVKNLTIPYGTVKLDEKGDIAEFVEKPELSFLTSTGFYIIEPEFLSLIPKNTFVHITDVIQQCISQNKKVGAFPISQSSWLDMGQLEEMEKMRERLKN